MIRVKIKIKLNGITLSCYNWLSAHIELQMMYHVLKQFIRDV